MKEVGERWLEARQRRELEELAKLTSEEATWHSPVNGVVRGRAAVLQQVRAAYAEADDFSTETLACEIRGDTTVAHVRNRGRRNGAHLDSHQWLVIKTRDGLVSDIDICVDDPENVEQFWA